jgi:hypothetical protein
MAGCSIGIERTVRAELLDGLSPESSMMLDRVAGIQPESRVFFGFSTGTPELSV